MSSRLAAMAAEENFCESFQAFHSSYSDTGLMGMYFVTDMHHIEDMMHWSQNAWSVPPPQMEVTCMHT
jgi:predicted Zn-dependent peptidase